MNEISNIIAGDTERWEESVSTDATSLLYYLQGPVTASFTGSVKSSGTFSVTMSSGVTATLTAGNYKLYGFLSSSDGRYSYSTTSVLVKSNPATTAPGIVSMTARQIVAAIDTAILNITTYGVASLSINGKSQTYFSPTELRELRNFYVSLMESEDADERLDNGSFGKVEYLAQFLP